MTTCSDKVRVQLYVDADKLATIDAAAKAVGENRSQYMMKAGLARSTSNETQFSDAQLKDMRMEILKIVAGFSRQQARNALAEAAGEV